MRGPVFQLAYVRTVGDRIVHFDFGADLAPEPGAGEAYFARVHTVGGPFGTTATTSGGRRAMPAAEHAGWVRPVPPGRRDPVYVATGEVNKANPLRSAGPRAAAGYRTAVFPQVRLRTTGATPALRSARSWQRLLSTPSTRAHSSCDTGMEVDVAGAPPPEATQSCARRVALSGLLSHNTNMERSATFAWLSLRGHLQAAGSSTLGPGPTVLGPRCDDCTTGDASSRLVRQVWRHHCITFGGNRS